jgi:hypothetical protein
MTPNSSPVTYCPVAEFLKRVDLRTVGDWASDTGARIPAVSLPTNANVLAALLDASGMVESAVIKSERYQPSDILRLIGLDPAGNPLVGFTPTAGTAYVYHLVTRIAEGLLWRRRPDISPFPPTFDWAMEELEALKLGGKILPFVETQEAGVPGHHVELETDVLARNLVITQARRFFGARGCDLNG